MKSYRATASVRAGGSAEFCRGGARQAAADGRRGGQSVIVYLVEFEPGGRTNWHRHSAPQLLLVKEGRGLVQKWGEPVRDIAAGDAVCIEPERKTLAWRRSWDENGALRRESQPDNRVARTRIGRPISCILSCKKPSTFTTPSSPRPARRSSDTRRKRRSPTSC